MKMLAQYTERMNTLRTLANEAADSSEHGKAVSAKFRQFGIQFSAELALDFSDHPAILKAVRKDAMEGVSNKSRSSNWSEIGRVVLWTLQNDRREDVEQWSSGNTESFSACRTLCHYAAPTVEKCVKELEKVRKNYPEEIFTQALEEFMQIA